MTKIDHKQEKKNMETSKKYETWKVVVGHGLGLRPSKKERRLTKLRNQYRVDLQNARKQCDNWIPFGYNLDLLKKDV